MNTPIRICLTDGGRSEAGFRGSTGDCACRALAIAADIPYKIAYSLVNQTATKEWLRKGGEKSSARTGVFFSTFRRLMSELGWTWHPTMQIGSGCKVHLRSDELPSGRLIVSLSRHYAAVIDGVLFDLSDCSRNGTRCVYGYWTKESPAGAPL